MIQTKVYLNLKGLSQNQNLFEEIIQYLEFCLNFI
jgi:hypothetical protein